MKTKLLNNLPFKIISVIAAIVLWLIVVNIDDTVETDVFKNLPVTLINTDTLTSQDQTYRIEHLHPAWKYDPLEHQGSSRFQWSRRRFRKR